LVAIGGSMTLAACTAIALSEKIVQDECQTDLDCQVLNDANFDNCHPYRCADDHFCEVGPLDSDRDGFIARQCEPDPEKQDCNDATDLDHPGADEVCDARDNDCDGEVDEDVLELDHGLVLDFQRDADAVQLGFAPDVDTNALSLAFTFAAQDAQVFISQLSFEGTSGAASAGALLRDDDAPVLSDVLALAPLTREPFALATYAAGAKPQLVIGAADPCQTRLHVSQAIELTSVHCAPAESCTMSVPPTRSLALATGLDGTLLVYRRSAGANGLCGDDHPPQQMLGNLFKSASSSLYEQTMDAVPIALSPDDAPPALLALPATTANDVVHGFLLGVVTEKGAIELRHLSVDSPSFTSSFSVSAPLLTESRSGPPLHSPQLALGDSSDPSVVEIGLLVERGCGDARRILLRRLHADLQADGGVSLKNASDWIELGDDPNQRAASLTWNARKGASWGVSYRDARGLHARLFDGMFAPLGRRTYALSDLASDGGDEAQATSIVPLRSSYGWFSVFSQSAGGEHGIARDVLRSCSPR
jgi:hypothetical protein